MIRALALLILAASSLALAQVPARCAPYRLLLQRECNVTFGAECPIAAIGGLVYQESRCDRYARNASDGGAGLMQLTGEANIAWLAAMTRQGKIDPWNAGQNAKAGVWLIHWATTRVQGLDSCQRFGAGASAYNGGLAPVLASQRISIAPAVWFGITEFVRAGNQSDDNFAAARSYPHKIVFTHQPMFAAWGRSVCL